MTIRILIAAVGIVLLLGTPVWAQSSTFDSLSPGNQKIANALFSAQNTTGTTLTPLTKDQIAGLKGTEGWGRVFKQMKADGLVQSKNLGQVVSAHQHALNAARRGSATTNAATARTGRSGRMTVAASTRNSGRVGGAGFAGGRGFAGSSHFGMGHGVAVSTMGSGGFGHGGGFGGGMGGGFGGGHGGGGGHGR